MRNAFLILFCSIQTIAFSQTIFSGKITDKMNKAVPDISVTLMTVKDSSIVAYSNTDDKGSYEIRTSRIDSEFLISVYSFGIKRQIRHLKNISQTVNFTVEESGSFAL